MRHCIMLGAQDVTRAGRLLTLMALVAGCAADKEAVDAPVLSDPSKADDGGQEIIRW